MRCERSVRGRASRKPVLYGYLTRWYDPDWGLDPWEWTYLVDAGYERWLRRNRLTADMVVKLLSYTLDSLDAEAANISLGLTSKVERMWQVLQRRVAFARNGGQAPPTSEELACLKALSQFEEALTDHGGDHFLAIDGHGRSIYANPTPQIMSAFAAIQRRFPTLMANLARQVGAEIGSPETLKLGRYAPPFRLGEAEHARAQAARLRQELGSKFLSPEASAGYRAARVRKWRQLACAGAARAEERERARSEQNKEARDAYLAERRHQTYADS